LRESEVRLASRSSASRHEQRSPELEDFQEALATHLDPLPNLAADRAAARRSRTAVDAGPVMLEGSSGAMDQHTGMIFCCRWSVVLVAEDELARSAVLLASVSAEERGAGQF